VYAPAEEHRSTHADAFRFHLRALERIARGKGTRYRQQVLRDGEVNIDNS
jgi:hypothetical protein